MYHLQKCFRISFWVNLVIVPLNNYILNNNLVVSESSLVFIPKIDDNVLFKLFCIFIKIIFYQSIEKNNESIDKNINSIFQK